MTRVKGMDSETHGFIHSDGLGHGAGDGISDGLWDINTDDWPNV